MTIAKAEFSKDENDMSYVFQKNTGVKIVNYSGESDQILCRGDLHNLPLGSANPVFVLNDGLVVIEVADKEYAIWYPEEDEE